MTVRKQTAKTRKRPIKQIRPLRRDPNWPPPIMTLERAQNIGKQLLEYLPGFQAIVDVSSDWTGKTQAGQIILVPPPPYEGWTGVEMRGDRRLNYPVLFKDVVDSCRERWPVVLDGG